MNLNLTIADLFIAYRKAKADAFYENGHHTAADFALYESKLSENLNKLLEDFNAVNEDWINNAFVGKYALTLKSCDEVPECENEVKRDRFVFFSDTQKQWDNIVKMDVNFRVIGQHSVNFHILSSLWIDKVGYRLETIVSENSYGCRLKRPKQLVNKFITDENLKDLTPDPKQLGHFRPYYGDYKKWQFNGIKYVKKALAENKKVVAVTADLKKFYYRIDPKFLLNESFLTQFNLQLSDEEQELTRLLCIAIEKWSEVITADHNLPEEYKVGGHCGVPLGLGASKVIANLLLTFLDKEIEGELLPVYYGRYVDDIFIVFEDNGRINSNDELWKFICKRIEYFRIDEANTDQGPIFETPYAKESLIEFGKGKEKLFVLEGSSGESFVDALKESLEEMSSEWKLLPDTESDLEALTKEMAKSSSDIEEAANGLRKSDGVSIQRLKFALHLRNLETVIELLPKKLWIDGLKSFFSLAEDFILAPSKIGTFTKYFPRLVKVAIRAEEPSLVVRIWDKIISSWETLNTKVGDDKKDLLKFSQDFNKKLLIEAVYTSLHPAKIRSYDSSKYWTKIFEYCGLTEDALEPMTQLLFCTDLHALPFKKCFIDDSLRSFFWRKSEILKTGYMIFTNDQYNSLNPNESIDFSGLQNFISKIIFDGEIPVPNDFVPKALIFYTRPFTTLEITYLVPDWSEASAGLTLIKGFLSLFNIPLFNAQLKSLHNVSNGSGNSSSSFAKLDIKDHGSGKNRVFALTSFQTSNESWIAWVRDDGKDPDRERYTRLFRLVNHVLTCKHKEIHYLVFPELSIPRSILLYLAWKLKPRKISLIAGAEYEKRDAPAGFPASIKGVVSNQLVYILNTTTRDTVEQVIVVQEKTLPAIHEESELYSVGGKLLMPRNETKYLINHGGFYFSGLICNDVLNIDNRTTLRGLIDALIVVEWNKDIEMYDSLIQASSNDLHCYVVQVNNRLYGDTRLRAPYKEAYMRDKVRVRGGELDYFVVSTLNVESLREFQRHHRSPEKPFKPVPTGFEMSDERRKK